MKIALLQIGAQEGTRTLTPYGTRPSNVCVYQFHHLSDYPKGGDQLGEAARVVQP